MEIDIDLKAIEDIKNKIDLFTKSQEFRLIGQTIYADIKEKFIDEKDVKGKPFAPLKQSTIKQKQRKGKVPYKILRDTGQLLNSLNFTTSGNKISIGYSVPYAKFHQNGTKYMPQRKILPTLDNEIPIDEINDIIKDYFINL